MNKTMKRIASVAVAGALALIPAGAAFAQTTAVPLTSNNYYVLGAGGSDFGGGILGNSYGAGASNLAQLFVLGALFNGAYGNGIVGGTSLGGLLELNQIFNGGNGYY